MKFTGELEIDEARGVVYFTPTKGTFKGTTILRICNLPVPIPAPVRGDSLRDITFGQGTSWGALPKVPRRPTGLQKDAVGNLHYGPPECTREHVKPERTWGYDG